MLNKREEELFNQAYSSYLNIIAIYYNSATNARENQLLIEKFDLDLQNILLHILDFENHELEKDEETFIQSLLYSATTLKRNLLGYSKFYNKMVFDNWWKMIDMNSLGFTEIPVLIEKSIQFEIKNIIDIYKNFITILKSFILLNNNNKDKIKNANILVSHIIDFYKDNSIIIDDLIIYNPFDNMDYNLPKDGIDELESLIGLTNVKNEVRKTLNIIEVNNRRKSAGLKETNFSKHMVFLGNPGTGKTTVARIIAQIYKENKIVTTGQLIEVDRADLVSEHIGGTAINVQQAIDRAIGGVLFIDEAYSLVPKEGGRDFGQEAISTLVKGMEDNKDNLVIIVAGYADEMARFINSNPGLESRFRNYFKFEDYSSDELSQIFEKMISNNGFIISKEAKSKCNKLWDYYQYQSSFGNGRGVRNIYENIIINQASRIVNDNLKDKDSLLIIEECDIPDLNNI